MGGDGRGFKNGHNFFLFDEITDHENSPFIDEILECFEIRIHFQGNTQTSMLQKSLPVHVL